METSSDIDLKCWYKPSCVGLLYEGTVSNNPSTSAASANLLNLMLLLFPILNILYLQSLISVLFKKSAVFFKKS